MKRGAGEKREWILETDDEEGEKHIEDLEDGHRLDDGVQRDGQPVPEELRPEKGVERCPCLVCGVRSVSRASRDEHILSSRTDASSEADQSGEMVLNQLAHSCD